MEKPRACCQNSSKNRSNLDKVTGFLKLINEPNRLKILCLLKNDGQCVCEIWKALGIRQNLTSHHLKELKDFGLIASRQIGRKVIYRSNKKVIQKYVTLINDFLISNL